MDGWVVSMDELVDGGWMVSINELVEGGWIDGWFVSTSHYRERVNIKEKIKEMANILKIRYRFLKQKNPGQKNVNTSTVINSHHPPMINSHKLSPSTNDQQS